MPKADLNVEPTRREVVGLLAATATTGADDGVAARRHGEALTSERLLEKVRNREIVRPNDFGAISWSANHLDLAEPINVQGCPDSTCALQRFLDFVSTHDGILADFTGRWGISAPLILGPDQPQPSTVSRFFGQCQFVALNAFDGPMLTVRNCQNWRYDGDISFRGMGFYEYHSRRTQSGIRFQGNNIGFALGGRIAGYFLSFATAVIVTSSDDRAEWVAIRSISSISVGSGMSEDPADRPDRGLTTSYSHIVANGKAFEASQSSLLKVDHLPQPWLRSTYGDLGTHHGAYVRIDGNLYSITNINHKDGTISIFPWLSKATARAGTLSYYFGGNLVLGGGDANLVNVELLEASGTGINLNACSLYPGIIGQAIAQSCGINVAIGARRGAPVRSTTINGTYSENTCHHLVLSAPGNTQLAIGTSIIDLAKISCLYEWDGENADLNPGLQGCTICVEGRWLTFDGKGDRARRNTGNDVYHLDRGDFRAAGQDNLTIFLAAPDQAFGRLANRSIGTVLVTGSGSNGQPTGEIKINARNIAASKINGSNEVSFRNLKRPLSAVISFDQAAGFKIYEIV